MSASSPRETLELRNSLKAKERELGVLKQQNDERVAMLQKTKAAIEELQQKLQEKTDQEEELRSEAAQIIDDQAQQIAAAEQAINELEQQVQELSSQLQAANAQLKRGAEEANMSSHGAQLEASTWQAMLQERNMRIESLEEALQASQDKAERLESSLKDQQHKSGFTLEATLRKAAEERCKCLEDDKQDLEQQLANARKGLNWELHEHEWTRRLQEVEMHWEKRLRDGMVACERKFDEEAGEAEARVQAIQAQWAAQLSDHQRALDMQRAHAEGQQAALLAHAEKAAAWEEVEHGLRAKVANLESHLFEHAKELQAAVQAERSNADRLWSGRLEAAQARWAHEMAAAAEQVAEAKAQAEADTAHSTELAQHTTHSQLAAAEASHKRAMEIAHNNWQQERAALQQTWQDRQQEAECLYKGLKEQLKDKVANIRAHLAAIFRREGYLDTSKKVGQQLDDLQATYELELQRRAESEAAALRAAQACRNQLEVARMQMDVQQRQLREAGLPILIDTSAKAPTESLLEIALGPSTASPTWPASPLHLNSDRPNIDLSYAPPPRHSTQPLSPLGPGSSIDASPPLPAQRPPSSVKRPPSSIQYVPSSVQQQHPQSVQYSHGGYAVHEGEDVGLRPDQDSRLGSSASKRGRTNGPEDSEVFAALQALQAASIGLARGPPPTSVAHSVSTRGVGVMTGGSLAGATQGNTPSDWPTLSPFPPPSTTSTLPHHQYTQPSSTHSPAAHTPQEQQHSSSADTSNPSLAHLAHSQAVQTQTTPGGNPISSKPTPLSVPQSLHTASAFEAIQAQLAAMRATVAATAAARERNGRPGLQAPTIEHSAQGATQPAVHGLAAQGSAQLYGSESSDALHGSMLPPPVLDRSGKGRLSPAAAKYLSRYREQLQGPAHLTAPSVGLPSRAGAVPVPTSKAPAGGSGSSHRPESSAAPSLGGFESVLAGNTLHTGEGAAGNLDAVGGTSDVGRPGIVAGNVTAGVANEGGAGGVPSALWGPEIAGMLGLNTERSGGSSLSSIAGSVGGSLNSKQQVPQNPPSSRTTRSVVRSLEHTLQSVSGASSRAGSKIG